MDSSVSDEIGSALRSLEGRAPKPLLPLVNAMLGVGDAPSVEENDLLDILCDPDTNATCRVRFQLLLSNWDGAPAEEPWHQNSLPDTVLRRSIVLEGLGFSPTAVARINEKFPRVPSAVVIETDEGEWTSWYDQERRSRDFYWNAYKGKLEGSGRFGPDAIGSLDRATSAVVRRLADPTWENPYQSRGLVVGYVQSGKTANFTGVIAKAIDAGYRLVIVLTGTVDILRQQTQRRLDMELVGEENILGGIDRSDTAKMQETDYWTDQDWKNGKFLKHGLDVTKVDDVPGIRRLTTYHFDYKSLKQGLDTLDFRGGYELKDKSRPLYDPENLFRSDVRLVVVKKNVAALRRLVGDLADIRANLGEIPTLIIDDEADQASVNTKRQKKGTQPTPEEKERTAINKQISGLLGTLSRAQYVGYTATPFANVFVDPDDSEDVFPRDFIVSLDRPTGYMGARDFHDLDLDRDVERTINNSNEKAHVRDLRGSAGTTGRTRELQRALDTYVLTGAIKVYREKQNLVRFRHHTMLMHESVTKVEHDQLADEVRELWRTSAYDGPAAMKRLRAIYDDDIRPVTDALQSRGLAGPEEALPDDFDDLLDDECLEEALRRIREGTSPVVMVNGDSDKDHIRAKQDGLDFEADDVWKILVGGTKLSRGFTVEGLTVTFYSRRTHQADTLMQMGRWFGFRGGYRDLVRLFIAREVQGPRNTTIDLYAAFEAAVRDEEDFREELRKFAHGDLGNVQIRPIDVPPMVYQQLPWLRPTSANKMYNAQLVSQGKGGDLKDFSMLPPRASDVNAAHFELVKDLVTGATSESDFVYFDVTTERSQIYVARHMTIEAGEFLDRFEQFKWATAGWAGPQLEFARECVDLGTLTEFVVVVPHLGQAQLVEVDGACVPLLRRTRRPDRDGFSGSSRRQRDAVEVIAGGHNDPEKAHLAVHAEGAAGKLHHLRSGAVLLTFAADRDCGSDYMAGADVKALIAQGPRAADIATLVSWALPYWAAPVGRIGFKAVRVDDPRLTVRNISH